MGHLQFGPDISAGNQAATHLKKSPQASCRSSLVIHFPRINTHEQVANVQADKATAKAVMDC